MDKTMVSEGGIGDRPRSPRTLSHSLRSWNRFIREPIVVKTGMSGETSSRPCVRIDRSDVLDRYRFVCPNGHTTWERTNSHAWCESCANAAQQGADVEPEFYEIHDKRTGESIPYSAIEFAGPDEESQTRIGGSE